MSTEFVYRLVTKTAERKSTYHRATATSKAVLSDYLRAKYHGVSKVTLEGVYTPQQFAKHLWSMGGLREGFEAETYYKEFPSLPTHVKHILTERAKRYVSSTRYVKGITAASSKKAVKAEGIRIEKIPTYRTYQGKRYKQYMTGIGNRANAEIHKQTMKRDNPAWRIRIEQTGATYTLYVRKRA